jgi:epoxyqueuosine reductase
MENVSPAEVKSRGLSDDELCALAARIKRWGGELGFSAVGIADVDLGTAERRLIEWIERGFHGEMHYMARHGATRAHPERLVPGTVRVIAARCDYLPASAHDWIEDGWRCLASPTEAYVARYAHGRDYHKVLRARLQALASHVAAEIGPFGHRVFTDSAPVLEVEVARRAGIGWRGKHTLLLSREGGSMYFLGEIFVDLALPTDAPVTEHCGTCERCIGVCPTGAIVAPYLLDARRCIAYLTIELKGSIPVEWRALIGNRIYGCDDCQLVCPWNKYAARATLDDFEGRGFDELDLLGAWRWDELEFERRTAGTAIRRIGFEQWLRNVAVALGNALNGALDDAKRAEVRAALAARASHQSALVREHVGWALAQGPEAPTTGA